MRQRILLISALMDNPDVLILDEPLSGLDATSALVIKNLIKELGQQKKAIFYCSHVLEVVEKVCSHLLILRQGNVIAYGRSEDIQREIGQFLPRAHIHAPDRGGGCRGYCPSNRCGCEFEVIAAVRRGLHEEYGIDAGTSLLSVSKSVHCAYLRQWRPARHRTTGFRYRAHSGVAGAAWGSRFHSPVRQIQLSSSILQRRPRF